jgi:hypothetical protein
VRGKDNARIGRCLGQFFDEYSSLSLETFDNGPVMHDLVPHIDRRTKSLNRQLDDPNRSIDACAKAARRGQEQCQGRAI